MKYSRELLFRPTRTPSVRLPFGARSTGYYVVGSDFDEDQAGREFVQFFWGIEGEGAFSTPEGEVVLGPRETFIYLAGDRHRIRSLSPLWRYRWMTLDQSVKEISGNKEGSNGTAGLVGEILVSFGLGRRLRSSGRCPEELFLQLAAEIRDLSPDGERRAAATAFRILSLAAACDTPDSTGSLVDDCLAILHAEIGNPRLGVEGMAGRLGVHRSVLSREFTAAVGVTPSSFITSLRMQRACSLLKESEESIFGIATRVGFSTANYFCKAFRKATGQSPGEFRDS